MQGCCCCCCCVAFAQISVWLIMWSSCWLIFIVSFNTLYNSYYPVRHGLQCVHIFVLENVFVFDFFINPGGFFTFFYNVLLGFREVLAISAQGGTCGTENCDGRGLMYSAWPIRVGWVTGSGWIPIWLTNADQLRSAHAEPGCQSNQPQSARVACGSSVKCVFWIWSLRPGCSKVSWDLWNGTSVYLTFYDACTIISNHFMCVHHLC